MSTPTDADPLDRLRGAGHGLVTASCLVGHPGRHLDWCLALVATWAGAD